LKDCIEGREAGMPLKDFIVGILFELLPAKQAECRDTPYIGLFTKLESNYISIFFNNLQSG
jgi:hypothetical protein